MGSTTQTYILTKLCCSSGQTTFVKNTQKMIKYANTEAVEKTCKTTEITDDLYEDTYFTRIIVYFRSLTFVTLL